MPSTLSTSLSDVSSPSRSDLQDDLPPPSPLPLAVLPASSRSRSSPRWDVLTKHSTVVPSCSRIVFPFHFQVIPILTSPASCTEQGPCLRFPNRAAEARKGHCKPIKWLQNDSDSSQMADVRLKLGHSFLRNQKFLNIFFARGSPYPQRPGLGAPPNLSSAKCGLGTMWKSSAE